MFGRNKLQLMAMNGAIDTLESQIRDLRTQIALITADRDDAEKLALRKLIRDLIGGKPNIDKFLDRLGDFAHLFEDGPPQGDMTTLLSEAGRALPGDLGEPT